MWRTAEPGKTLQITVRLSVLAVTSRHPINQRGDICTNSSSA
ncbi:MAG: hypothetical protein OXH52_16830 [Gammaproteobacteria bacterium]|nr:hypothetical protein [Gammaproteobacteria bacterium]